MKHPKLLLAAPPIQDQLRAALSEHGALEMKELKRQLRRGGGIELEGKLATGAVPIVTDAKIASKGAAQATRERIEREGRQ